MIARGIFLFFCCVLCRPAAAQPGFPAIAADSLQSRVSGRHWQYYVHLPASYRDDRFGVQRYPVIYILDAGSDFAPLVAAVDFLSAGMLPRIPECIVVGILHQNRTYELTPFASSEGKDFPGNGGADIFGDFLAEELLPHIDRSYRTNGVNALFGHSFGGLFSLYLLSGRPGLFRHVLASDPSLWWDDALHSGAFLSFVRKEPSAGFQLFVASSGHDTAEEPEYLRVLRQFTDSLAGVPSLSGRFTGRAYPDSDHATIMIHALPDALEWFYRGYKMGFGAFDNPATIPAHYEKLSLLYGYRLIPPCPLLTAWVDYFMEQGQKEHALEVWNLAAECYPSARFLKSEKYKALWKN